MTNPSFNKNHQKRTYQVSNLHWICPWSQAMAVGNSHSFHGLKARDVPIERGTAAFCSRAGMVTVVIGVSLVREKAN